MSFYHYFLALDLVAQDTPVQALVMATMMTESEDGGKLLAAAYPLTAAELADRLASKDGRLADDPESTHDG